MAPQKPVTLRDIAFKANVSQSVVSTILNDRRNGIFVSDSTRQNVLKAAADLGYVVRQRAASSRQSAPRRGSADMDRQLIGLLLGRRFGGSLFTDIFYGVNSALAAAGFHPVVLDTYADTYHAAAKKEEEGLRYAQSHGFGGLVLWHEGGHANVPLIRQMRAEMPVVAIDRRVNGVELDFVGTDNFAGGYQATQHLIQLGHTRIAHLTRLETTDSALERLRGYQQALTDSGLEVNPRHILLALESGRRLDSALVRQVFTSPDAPTAVFVMADFWAPPLYEELRKLGLRVPEDVSIIGFDDVIQPGLDHIGLTTMAQNFEGIGRSAAEHVLRRLGSPDEQTANVVYPAKLVVRSSTSAPQRLTSASLHGSTLVGAAPRN